MSENELVAVMVPKLHLSRVYGLIAKLEGVDSAAQEVKSPHLANGALGDWTPSLTQRMVSESPTAMGSILRAMAERPGEWLTVKDLAAAISHKADWNTVAGTLGAFGRRQKNRYKINTPPFEKRYDHTVGKVYRMSKEMADQIIKAMQNGK